MDEEEDGFQVKEFKPSANFNYRLSKKQIFKMKQIFDVYDDDCDGIIDIEHLGVAMRAAGMLISDSDIELTKKQLVEQGVIGKIEMSQFFLLMARKFRDGGDIEKAAKVAFKSIYTDPNDPLTRRVPLKVLKVKLSLSGGEPLIEDEVDTFTREIRPDLLDHDGVTADYDNLIEWILEDIPDLKLDEDETKSDEKGEKEDRSADDEKEEEELETAN